jgi:hypothetical protein
VTRDEEPRSSDAFGLVMAGKHELREAGGHAAMTDDRPITKADVLLTEEDG